MRQIPEACSIDRLSPTGSNQMALLGQAALAMWWDMAPQVRKDFEDWHTHEHFPERLAIPGFRRSSRWTAADGGEGIFVLYELESYDVLSSARYLARLNAPTPWSTKLMPHHRNMVRGQTRVLASHGAVIARQALTVRLTPVPGRANALREGLEAVMARLACAPGIAGTHLLQHQAPDIPQTTEQKIRGGSDRAVDWVLIVSAYDPEELHTVASNDLSTTALEDLGAEAAMDFGIFNVSCSATCHDLPCERMASA